jgi:hypothetical protein
MSGLARLASYGSTVGKLSQPTRICPSHAEGVSHGALDDRAGVNEPANQSRAASNVCETLPNLISALRQFQGKRKSRRVPADTAAEFSKRKHPGYVKPSPEKRITLLI